MATHREGASRQERRQGPQRRRQSAVCGCGSVGVAHRFALARPSGRVWQLEQRVSAFPPLGDKGRLGKSFQCVSRRPRFRIPYDRRNHRPRSPACGGRKGGSENEAIGRSRGGLSTKINVAVDALGNPLRLILTEGQVHDIRQAEALIEGFACEKVLADKGYDSDKFREVIASKAPRPLSRPNVQERNSSRTIKMSIKTGTLSSVSSTRLKTSGASPRDTTKPPYLSPQCLPSPPP